MAEIVGYFAWEKNQKGTADPVKCDATREMGLMPETKARKKLITVSQHSLSQQEWSLSLDQLAHKYPCPPLPPVRERKDDPCNE